MVGGVKKGQTSRRDVRHFASSLSLPPEAMLDIVVSRWQVEISRCMLDKTFREDERRAWRGNGPAMPSFFRKLALNLAAPICRLNERTSVAEVLEAFANDFDYLMWALKRRPEEVLPPKELGERKVKVALEAAETKRQSEGKAKTRPKSARLKAA